MDWVDNTIKTKITTGFLCYLLFSAPPILELLKLEELLKENPALLKAFPLHPALRLTCSLREVRVWINHRASEKRCCVQMYGVTVE